MKTLILTVTLLNFMVYFSYNGSQEIRNQTNQHLSVNPSLFDSDSHTASQNSSILRPKENSPPTNGSNSYFESTDRVSRLPESLSKRNHSETLQTAEYNLTTFGLDVPANSTANQTSVIYRHSESTLDNSTQAEVSKSSASSSSAAVQDTSTIVTNSRFVPNSRLAQRRMSFSTENSMAPALSTLTRQSQYASAASPYFQTNYKTTQLPEYFFPATGRSNPSASFDLENTMNKFADESTTIILNTDELLKADSTLPEEAAKSSSISFIDTTAAMKEDDREDIVMPAILNYITKFDELYSENKNMIIIDNTDLEVNDKTGSRATLPWKDNYIVTDGTDVKNNGGATVKTQRSSIPSIKNNRGFEFVPSNYEKAGTKSMIAGGTDEVISNVSPVYNYRMYKKSNDVISNSYYPKTIADMDKNTMHGGNLIVPKTNSMFSAKNNINPIPIEPTTNANIKHKTTWSSKDSSNIPANAHLKTDMSNLQPVSTYGVKYAIPVVQEIENIDQDDRTVEEIIITNPDMSVAEIGGKIYFLNPNEYYVQTAGDKIITPSDTANMFNPQFKYEIKPFTKESTKGSRHVIPTTMTTNDAKAKTDANRITGFKRANLQKDKTPLTPVTYPGTVGPVYISEDGDKISSFKVSIAPSDKSTDSVYKIIIPTANNNHDDGTESFNSNAKFPISKELTLLSITDPSSLSLITQNNEAQSLELIEDDSLAGAWISFPVTENVELTDDIIMQKRKSNKVSVDPQKSPLVISPYSDYNIITITDKGDTDLTYNSNLMTSKSNTPEKGANELITPQSTKATNVVTTIKRSGDVTNKEITNEEKLMPYVNMRPVVKDAAFQIRKDLPPSHNFKYSESGEIGRNGFATFHPMNYLSQLNSIMPTAEATKNDRVRQLITPEEENSNALYDVTHPTNDKTHFQWVTAKGITNDLAENAAIRQNVEERGTVKIFLGSDTVPLSGRMNYQMVSNSNDNGITDDSLTTTKEISNVAQHTMEHKLSLSPTDNEDLTVYRYAHQPPPTINAINSKTLVKKDKLARTEITNSPFGISTIADGMFSVDKDSEGSTDFTSLTATSILNKGNLNKNEVNSLSNKSNKPEDDFTISREDTNGSRKGDSLFVTDSSILIRSLDPSEPYQATNPIKKISLADIIMPSYVQQQLNSKASAASVTSDSQVADTVVYTPNYKPDSALMEESTLNYEEYPPKDIGIIGKDKGVFTEKDIMSPMYILPTAGQKRSKGNYLSNKHYFLNSDPLHNGGRFKEIYETTAGRPEDEGPALSYGQNTEISNSPVEKFIPEFQEKVSIMNSNSGPEYEASFGGNIHYPMMIENVPKGHILSPERNPALTAQTFRIPEKYVNPALEGSALLDQKSANNNYFFYTDDQTGLRTKEVQTAKSSRRNPDTGVVPEMFSIPIFSEDVSVENYYQMLGTDSPPALGLSNTLQDVFFIPNPWTTLAEENNLYDKEIIITEPDINDSEYFSRSTAFEFEKNENYPMNRHTPFTYTSKGFISQIPFPKGEVSRNFRHSTALPEVEPKEKYQTIILKEGSSDSDVSATRLRVPQAEHVYAIEESKNDSKAASEASLDPASTLKMPTNTITPSPGLLAFNSKPVDALSAKYSSLTDTSVTLKRPEPLDEHAEHNGNSVTDPNWEITKAQSDTEPFFMSSSIPLRSPTIYLRNPDTATTGKVSSDDKVNTATFLPDKFHQAVIHKNKGTNEVSDYPVNYPVNSVITTATVKKISTSDNETDPLLNKEQAIAEDKYYITDANKPMNLRAVDSRNVNAFILNPDVASSEQMAPGTLKQIFNLTPSISTTKLIKAYLAPPYFTAPINSPSYPEIDQAVTTKAYAMTKAENNAPFEGRHTPAHKVITPPRINNSRKGMLKNILRTRFEHINLLEREMDREYEEISETENVPDIILDDESIPGDDNMNTVLDKNMSEEAWEIIQSNLDTVTTIFDDRKLSVGNVYKPGEGRNGPLTATSLATDSNVFESDTPYAGVAFSQHLSQPSSADKKNGKKHQIMFPQSKNSKNDATLLKSSINFHTKVPKFTTQSLADSVAVVPESLNKRIIEHVSLDEDNNSIIPPNNERIEYPLVPGPQQIITEEREMFTTDSNYPAMVTKSIQYQDQLSRKSALDNEAKTSMSSTLYATKHKPNVAKKLHSLNNIPATELIAIPGDSMHHISKVTDDMNSGWSIFSPSVEKVYSTAVDVVLPTEESYDGDSKLPRQVLTSTTVTPDSSAEASGQVTGNSLWEPSVPTSNVLERATEYANIIPGRGIPVRQVMKAQTDTHSYPLIWKIPPKASVIFLDSVADDKYDRFLILNRNTAGNYKTMTDRAFSRSQKSVMEVFSPRENSYNSDDERGRIASPFYKAEPLTKLELRPFTNTNKRKNIPLATAVNPHSETDDTDTSFAVKLDAPSLKPQIPSNEERIFLTGSTFFPEESRTVSYNKFTNTGDSITTTPTGLHGRERKSTFPAYGSTTSMGTSRYSQLIPISNGNTGGVDYTTPPEEILILPDQSIASPSVIPYEKDTASTFRGSPFNYRYLTERKTEAADKTTTVNKNIFAETTDQMIIIPDGNDSEYGSDMGDFELQDIDSNFLMKVGKIIHTPKTGVYLTPHNTGTVSDNLSKATSPDLKLKRYYQAMPPRQENMKFDTDVRGLKIPYPSVNIQAYKPPNHFPLSTNTIGPPIKFFDKTPVGKSSIRANNEIVLSESFDLGNKMNEYTHFSNIRPTIGTTFSTDTTDHDFKNNHGHFYKRKISPTIYKIATPQREDTSTFSNSGLTGFTEYETGISAMSDSTYS